MSGEKIVSSDSAWAVLDAIGSVDRWKRDATESELRREVHAAVAERHAAGCISYEHDASSGTLELEMPDYSSRGAAKLLLFAPLDRTISRSQSGGFVRRLCEVHRALGEAHATRYGEGIADPTIVYRARIPVTVDRERVVETARESAAVATDVAELHRSLFTTIEQFRLP